MSQIARAELLELFFGEVESYLPRIRECLAELTVGDLPDQVFHDLLRLYHNIKGAASQVKLGSLSDGARVVEDCLDAVVARQLPVSGKLLAALGGATDRLQSSLGQGEDAFDNYGREMAELFVEVLSPSTGGYGAKEMQLWQKSLGQVFSLLTELTSFLGRNTATDLVILSKLASGVGAVAGQCRGFGLNGQARLLSGFGELIENLPPDQPALATILTDYLQLFEVALADAEPDRLTGRVDQHLQGLVRLVDSLKPEVAEPLSEESEGDLFAEPELTDALEFMEELGEEELPVLPLEDQTFVQEIVTPAPSEALLDEDQRILMEIFKAECEEHLIEINRSLNNMEQAVPQTVGMSPELRETVAVMRRSVHTLKGAAGMTGVNLLARAAHCLEDMLDWIHDRAGSMSPAEVEIIAGGVELIELMAQVPEQQESDLLTEFVARVDSFLASSAATALPSAEEAPEPAITAAPTEEVVEEAVPQAEPEQAGELPLESGMLRVRLGDFDELVNIEGDLVIARGGMEKGLAEVSRTLLELDTVKDNLRRKSQELEAGFEVQALYGFSPGGGKGAAPDTLDGGLGDFDPIELDRYSELNLIIRSLNEISVDVNSIALTMNALVNDLKGQVARQQLTMRLMQDKLMRMRMTPMSTLSRMLFRTVRDTARRLGKRANLTIVGEEIYMDRLVWSKVADPLMHILRNCVDHGIETVESRRQQGKPESGSIRLIAQQRSRFVVLTITDDGGGVDLDMVRNRLRALGIEAEPEKLSEAALLDHLFDPSFSTKTTITDISGRGVGLDVVKRNVQALRGTLKMWSEPGKGTTFELQLPFTLSVNRAAFVAASDRIFAIPLQDIAMVRMCRASDFTFNDGLKLVHADEEIKVHNLGYYLGLSSEQMEVPEEGQQQLVILYQTGERLVAMAVEKMVEQREIVVKGLGTHLTHVHGISGVTQTGSGELIPIVNLRELVEERTGAERPVIEEQAALLEEPLKILVVDDSISVRHSVARLLESQGWVARQATDGMDALAVLESYSPDVIILDIEMPRMNGYEFKSSINNHEEWGTIPVIMLTSRASEKHQQKARELGVEHYVTKPYQDVTFIRLIEEIRAETRQ